MKVIVEKKTIEYQELLITNREKFRKKLKIYARQVAQCAFWGDIDLIRKYHYKAHRFEDKLQNAAKQIDAFNDEEIAFGWELSQYPLRKATTEALTPYRKLYDNAISFFDSFEKWVHSKVGSFEPEEIENELMSIYRDIMKLEKSFADHPIPRNLAGEVSPLSLAAPFSRNLAQPRT